MDSDLFEQEVHTVLRNIDLSALDETSKEYTVTVNNASKLHSMLINEREIVLKEGKDDFDKKIRNKQLNFEKQKHDDEMREKKMDRLMDGARIKYQQLRIREKEADNQRILLEQNQTKMEHEFKMNKITQGFIFGGKLVLIGVVGFVYWKVFNKELKFEYEDNGITPSRCKEARSGLSKLFGMIF